MKKILIIFSNKYFQWLTILLFAFFIGLITWFKYPNGGMDMRDDIQPALLNWRTPWKEGTPLFPWSTFILFPLRFLSSKLATIVINTFSILLLPLLIRKFNGNILLTIPIVLSPVGIPLIANGQTDVIIFSSLLLPAGFDLLFLWKPQVSIHAYWVRIKKKPWLYLSVTLFITILSFAIWGFWPKEVLIFARGHLLNGWWNKTLWPWSIPIGLIIVYYSIKSSDEGLGVIASPLLFPYVNIQSYIGLITIIACKWPKIFITCYIIVTILLLFVNSNLLL